MTNEERERLSYHVYEDLREMVDQFDGWPEARSTDSDEPEWRDDLDTENFEVVTIGDDFIEVVAGGDWQEPRKVRLLLDGTCQDIGEITHWEDGIEDLSGLDIWLDLAGIGIVGRQYIKKIDQVANKLAGEVAEFLERNQCELRAAVGRWWLVPMSGRSAPQGEVDKLATILDYNPTGSSPMYTHILKAIRRGERNKENFKVKSA